MPIQLDQNQDNLVLFDDVRVSYSKGFSEVGSGYLARAQAASQLDTKVNQQGDSLTSVSQSITNLQNTVGRPGGQTGLAGAIGLLETTVSQQGGAIQSQGQQITGLDNSINNPQTGLSATAQALSSLQQGVFGEGGETKSITERLDTLSSEVGHANFEALNQLVGRVENNESGVSSALSKTESLETRIDTTESYDIVAPPGEQLSIPTKTEALHAEVDAHARVFSDVFVRLDKTDDSIQSSIGKMEVIQAGVGKNTQGLQANQQAINNVQLDIVQAGQRIDSVVGRTNSIESQIGNPSTGLSASASRISDVLIELYGTGGSKENPKAGSTIKAIDTLQSTVGNHTTAIQTQQSITDGLKAQAALKIDNNGHVSGVGLASSNSDQGVLSEFIINADRFMLTTPSTTWKKGANVVKGEFYSPTGGSDAWLYEATKAGKTGNNEPSWPTTEGATVNDGGTTWKAVRRVTLNPITSTRINGQNYLVLNSEVMIGGSLSVSQLTEGKLDENASIIVGDNNIVIGGDGTMVLSGDGGPAINDYMALSSGELKSFKLINGSHYAFHNLQKVESGTAENGETVILSGAWPQDEPPQILVSPNHILSYDPTYANQKQAWVVSAENVAKSGIGWKFSAVARLELGEASGFVSLSLGSGNVSGGYTTTTITTPANTKKITVNVSASSVRGTGNAPNYYRRSYRARILYGTTSGNLNSSSGWVTYSLGQSHGNVAGSLVLTLAQANKYYYKVQFEALDAGGTFSYGSQTYEYDQVTLTGGTISLSGSGINNRTAASSLPSYTPSSGYSVYDVSYSAKMSYSITMSAGFPDSINVLAGTRIKGVLNARTQWSDSPKVYSFNNYNVSGSKSSYNRSELDLTLSFSGNGSAQYNITLSDLKAVVKTRKRITNSTTAVNNFSVTGYSYELSSAMMIKGGSLNYLAIS